MVTFYFWEIFFGIRETDDILVMNFLYYLFITLRQESLFIFHYDELFLLKRILIH